MHVAKLDINGNPNIGLYAFATDDYCLVGKEVPEHMVKELEKVLKVPIHSVNLCGTSLIGVFATGNKNCLLIPEIVFDEELKVLDRLKIRYAKIKTNLTALGNNILANDKGCIINNEFTKEAKSDIERALKVKTEYGTIASFDIVGSSACISGQSCLAHSLISDPEKRKIEKLMGITVETGTVNFGVSFVRSGIISNKNGFAIGHQSTGIEIQNADIALGFLQG